MRYACTLTMLATVTVTAPSGAEALRRVRDAIDGTEANLGSWETGDPIVTVVEIDGFPRIAGITEEEDEDEEAQDDQCRTCHGPLGLDGWDGECGNCADKREARS